MSGLEWVPRRNYALLSRLAARLNRKLFEMIAVMSLDSFLDVEPRSPSSVQLNKARNLHVIEKIAVSHGLTFFPLLSLAKVMR